STPKEALNTLEIQRVNVPRTFTISDYTLSASSSSRFEVWYLYNPEEDEEPALPEELTELDWEELKKEFPIN
ncbi:hypothetical protein N7530_010334, partial [Penicillium desertorum]